MQQVNVCHICLIQFMIYNSSSIAPLTYIEDRTTLYAYGENKNKRYSNSKTFCDVNLE